MVICFVMLRSLVVWPNQIYLMRLQHIHFVPLLDHPDAYMTGALKNINQIDLDRILATARSGTASGPGCNSLINSLVQILPPPTNKKRQLEIRRELRKRFPSGRHNVSMRNFLSVDAHCQAIIELLGFAPSDFKVTCIARDLLCNGAVVGDGPQHIYLMRLQRIHFVPLLLCFQM